MTFRNVKIEYIQEIPYYGQPLKQWFPNFF